MTTEKQDRSGEIAPPAQPSMLDDFFTHLVPLWPSLHSLSESKIVKSSYVWLVLVPAMAKLLDAIDHKITLFGNVVVLSLPFSPKIFYFAAVAFAGANIIYYVFCPPAVKGYRSYKEFSEASKGSDVLMAGFVKLLTSRIFLWPLAFGEDAKRTFLQEYTDFKGKCEDINPKKPESLERLYSAPISLVKLPKAFNFVQWNFFRALPLVRLVCSALYLIGFFLIAWLFYENLRFVIETLR
jgi:hypothetical protein